MPGINGQLMLLLEYTAHALVEILKRMNTHTT